MVFVIDMTMMDVRKGCAVAHIQKPFTLERLRL